MDRSTCIGFVSAKVEDPDRSRFTATQYEKAVDLAQEQFSVDSRSISKESTLTAVAEQAYIALPSDFLVCVLVRHKGLKLRPTTRYELSFQAGEDWTTLTSGTPNSFYIDDQNERLCLVPKPDAASAGAYITLNYIAVPPAMTSDADVLLSSRTILQYYAPAVVAWAARELLSYVPTTDAVLAKQNALLKEYDRYKNQAIATYNNMADEPIRMTGGRHWQDATGVQKSNAYSD